MSEDAIDPAELLERLRSEHPDLSWAPLPPSGVAASWRQRPLRDQEALAYLNGHWVLPGGPTTVPSGRGLRGTVRRLVGRLTFSVLHPYLTEERELLARLVQVCNALAARCDELSSVIADRERAEGENGVRLVEWIDSTRPPGARADRDAGGQGG